MTLTNLQRAIEVVGPRKLCQSRLQCLHFLREESPGILNPYRAPSNPSDGLMEKGSLVLPIIVTTSVIRSTDQGDSHGGAYLVDLATGSFKQVLDWNAEDIDWSGRGGDRGLRGIAFHEDNVYLAASDEVFIYTRSFRCLGSIKNPYLKHCHELSVWDDCLYLTSTGYDSILKYDLVKERFVKGWVIRYGRVKKFLKKARVRPTPAVALFNPMSDGGPREADTIHLNNVHVNESGIYVCGTQLGALFRVSEVGTVMRYACLPYGTHNARPIQGGIVYNSTNDDKVIIGDRKGNIKSAWEIPKYPPEELKMNSVPDDHARQGFSRGLIMLEAKGLVIVGSSPATISVFMKGQRKPLRQIRLSKDVRNAIHGLECWPF